MIHILNTFIVPPFYWINQWRPFFRCCWFHDFDVLSLRFSRSSRGGVHVSVAFVVLGIGCCWTCYDRNSRAVFLAQMDQFEEEVKDAVREQWGMED